MRFLSLTIFYILVSSQCFSFGIGDWVNTTPSGNQMGDPGGGAIFNFKEGGQEITGIERWYFYHEHTIGKYNKGYFIINEKDNSVKIFENENAWQAELSKENVVPKIWTRWYSDNWAFYDQFIIILFLGVPFNILFIGFILWAIVKAIKSESLNIKKPYTLILISLIVLGLLLWIPDLYPQSI